MNDRSYASAASSTLWDVVMHALRDVPKVAEGTDLADLVCDALASEGLDLREDDLLVVAQKVVSKAEGRTVRLDQVDVSDKAEELAEQTGRHPALCQLYLDESSEILAVHGRHVVTRHRLGFEGTGAGVDMSNASADGEVAVLLPLDPDRSARQLRDHLMARIGQRIAVVISDSFGSPSRFGALGAAIGLSGIRPVDRPETLDLYGRESKPMINRVDALVSVAVALMGEAGEGRPIILIRGAPYTVDDTASIRDLLISST